MTFTYHGGVKKLPILSSPWTSHKCHHKNWSAFHCCPFKQNIHGFHRERKEGLHQSGTKHLGFKTRGLNHPCFTSKTDRRQPTPWDKKAQPRGGQSCVASAFFNCFSRSLLNSCSKYTAHAPAGESGRHYQQCTLWKSKILETRRSKGIWTKALIP